MPKKTLNETEVEDSFPLTNRQSSEHQSSRFTDGRESTKKFSSGTCTVDTEIMRIKGPSLTAIDKDDQVNLDLQEASKLSQSQTTGSRID